MSNVDFTIGHTFHPPCLPLDKPWPNDLRRGFENDYIKTEVWLDSVKLGGVVAADPDTGYYLNYSYQAKRADRVSFVATQKQPCDCLPNMHSFTLGNDYCIPMHIKHGNIKIKRTQTA